MKQREDPLGFAVGDYIESEFITGWEIGIIEARRNDYKQHIVYNVRFAFGLKPLIRVENTDMRKITKEEYEIRDVLEKL